MKLPCGTIIDRPVIRRHLMNQPTNPFTQLPLEVTQLVEQPDLKSTIIAWFTAWQAKRQSGSSNAAGVYLNIISTPNDPKQ